MPLVTVPARPNGLPIATTGSPTCDRVRVAERERVEHRRRRVDLDHGEVGRAVGADEVSPCSVLPFQNVTVIELAPPTTCWFVTMSPFVS